MKKYQQAIVSVAFLTLLLSAGLNIGLPDVDTSENNAKGKEKSELILNSFENADYRSWKAAVGKNMIGNLVSNNDFNHFLAARTAVRSGNYDQAINLTNTLEAKLKNHLGVMYLG